MRPALYAFTLEMNVLRVPVVARSEIDRLAEFSVGRPLRELYFDDDFGAHPVCGLVGTRRCVEWRRSALERRELPVHRFEARAREAASRKSDVAEAIIVIEVA